MCVCVFLYCRLYIRYINYKYFYMRYDYLYCLYTICFLQKLFHMRCLSLILYYYYITILLYYIFHCKFPLDSFNLHHRPCAFFYTLRLLISPSSPLLELVSHIKRVCTTKGMYQMSSSPTYKMAIKNPQKINIF